MNSFDFESPGWQEPRRSTSSAQMTSRHPRSFVFGSDERHQLNDELERNVDHAFHVYHTETPSVFEEGSDTGRHFFSPQPELNDDVSDPLLERSGDGYMHRTSPFSLDSPQDELASFMEWYPPGTATILYPNDDGDVESVPHLSLEVFEERCPLLAQAFEPSKSGPKLYLEAMSPATATPFVRYLYTGSYAVPRENGDIYEDVPTSVLLHCQLFRLGDIYDLPDLRQQAYVNVLRQCEFGCSSPDRPIDLCEAVRYAYEHLRDHTSIIDAIICYCVTCFLKHRLGDSVEFLSMAYNLRPFHQDLAKECMKRDFEDETASAIIQMPFEPCIPETYASREDVTVDRCADMAYHFHGGGDDYEGGSRKRKRPEMVATGEIESLSVSALTLAIRRKCAESAGNSKGVKYEEEALNAEDLGIGSSKRRASTTRREPCLSSDSEFELVHGPERVEEIFSSDSDSDAGSLVVVDRLALPAASALQQHALPFRSRDPASSVTLVESTAAEDADNESEFEWVDDV